jgi:hypothetical protein
MTTIQSPFPEENGGSYTDSSDSLLIICDTPGDTTRPPEGPNQDPPGWPPPKPPEDQPSAPEKT